MKLSDIRKQIDRLDGEILTKLNARARLAQKVGQCKKQAGEPFYVPNREEALLAALAKKNKGPLGEKDVRAVYKEIISACIAQQTHLRIAYLGPEATFTHQAALKNFGHAPLMRALTSIPDVFAAVERDEADYGVVPIENSTEGAVFHSQDMLVNSELKIIAQIFLPVSQCLLSNTPLSKIKQIVSKDVALGQCRQWLLRNLPEGEWVECASTALAAQQAAKKPGVAAIAGTVAADIYGLKVLARDIQDCVKNVTRFLVLGKMPSGPTKGGIDRTSIVFSLNKDEAGSLEKALMPFSTRGISLSKIESRPSRSQLWEYFFFVDFLGHRDDKKIAAAMKELELRCTFLKWLGSYPETQA